MADTTRASLGLLVVEYVVADSPLEVWVNPATGQSTGMIKHPDFLPQTVKNLAKQSQVDGMLLLLLGASQMMKWMTSTTIDMELE